LPAIIDNRLDGRTWSYREIEDRSILAGKKLLTLGSRRGDRVAIIADNSAELLCCYLGAMRVGLVAVPINFKLPPSMIDFILKDSGATLAVTDKGHANLVPPGFVSVRLDDETFISRGDVYAGYESEEVFPEPGEIAEILYTSGSTGRPKGVPLSHDGQIWALSVHVQCDPLLAERTIVAAPMYHMNAIISLSVALMNGIRVILMPRFKARDWLQAIEKYQCTVIGGIPSMLAMAAQEVDLINKLNFSSVRRVSIGSAPLSEALIERIKAIFPNAMVSNGYGTTEAGPSVFGDHPNGRPRPPLSVGYPIDGIQWRLTRGTETEGVLEVKTPALLQGYWNLPEVTETKIREGWYDTGDIMRRDSDGFFFFVGRSDDMFVCGGENVFPGEIEKMIEKHPGVVQAAVVAVPDSIKGQVPIAFVVIKPGSRLSTEELKEFSLREGPAYSHPRAFVFVESVPVGSTHKVDKRPLMELAIEASRSAGRR